MQRLDEDTKKNVYISSQTGINKTFFGDFETIYEFLLQSNMVKSTKSAYMKI